MRLIFPERISQQGQEHLLLSLGYHAVIREPLRTGCLYVQPAHVDYLQALGFPAAKASSGCLTNPSSERCHTVKTALG